MKRMKGWVVMNKHHDAGGRATRIIAVIVASLALAGAVQAQAWTGAWKVGSGTPVTLKGSNPATGEPNSSSLAVGCNLRTGRIYGGVSVIPFFFPNGKAVLTWDEREDVLRTFEGMEGFDYPAIFLLTEDLSFLDNIIGHNRLTVSAEVEIEGRRARMESRFDLSGSQAAFRTLRCWPPSARPAPSNPPSEALERARQKCRETFSDDFVLQNACIEQQEEAYRERESPINPTNHGRECPAGAPTWMGLPVCEEGVRVGYDRDTFGSAYSSLEDEIIDSLPKSGGQVYTPYICKLFDIRADGTATTDIEHIVALAEAYDSGLAESQFRIFAGDLDNLTIAYPAVNRSQKSDRDAGEWEPAAKQRLVREPRCIRQAEV